VFLIYLFLILFVLFPLFSFPSHDHYVKIIMLFKLSTAAVASIVTASLVSSAPAGKYLESTTWSSSVAFPTEVSADGSHFKYPLSNGFPSQNEAAINDTEVAAGGTLSNAPPPTSLQPDSIINLRLIAFNELSEVAFFTELLQNITSNQPGFEIPEAYDRDYVIDSLIAIQAQEELHTLNANNALSKFDGNGIGPIQACEYDFPVNNLLEAITVANQFTDLVLGTLQDVIVHFANNKDVGPIAGVASVIGQEGEQDGFFRLLLGERPSAQPFLTESARDFAFSALNQNFVKKCPQDVTKFGLNIFQPLVIVDKPQPGDGSLTFDFTLSSNSSRDNLQLVYLSGQNLPIIEEIEYSTQSYSNGSVQFKADFPQATDILDGLTIAVVTTKGNFTTLDQVVQNTKFGPALIEVN